MKIYLAFVLTLNLICFGVLLPIPGEKSIDSAMAKLVVSQNLEKISEIAPDGTIKLSSGCAEPRGNKGLVTGSGQALNQAQRIEGIPVYRSTQFSYRAMVSTACSSYNLNCYGVDAMDLDGTTSVAPRL